MDAPAQPTAEEQIWIIGVREGGQDRGPFSRKTIEREPVKVEQLSAQLAHFVRAMHRVVTDAQSVVSGFPLDEVTVTVEIGAKGSVSLLGTGGEVSGSGGMTLTFKRAQLAPSDGAAAEAGRSTQRDEAGSRE